MSSAAIQRAIGHAPQVLTETRESYSRKKPIPRNGRMTVTGAIPTVYLPVTVIPATVAVTITGLVPTVTTS